MILIALALFLLTVWLLPPEVMLWITVAVLLLAVAHIWAKHRMDQVYGPGGRAFTDLMPGDLVEDHEPQIVITRSESQRVIAGPDHPLWVKGRVPR